jgi:hypothetical protein
MSWSDPAGSSPEQALPQPGSVEQPIFGLVVADSEYLARLDDHRDDLVRLDLILGDGGFEGLFDCAHYDFANAGGVFNGVALLYSTASADGRSDTFKSGRAVHACGPLSDNALASLSVLRSQANRAASVTMAR